MFLRLLLTAQMVLAQDGPCVGLPDGCDPSRNVLAEFIPAIGNLFVTGAAGFAVVFVMWGGFQMMINFGEEQKFTQGRNSIIYALLGFGFVLASQSIVAFVLQQATPAGETDAPIPALMEAAVNTMLVLFNVTFVLVTIYSGVRMVMAKGSAEDFNTARTMIIWAIVGAIIINVAHALVRAVLGLGL